jgi:hypothetical protein
MLHELVPPPLFQVAVLACFLLPTLLLVVSWIAPNKFSAKHRLGLAIFTAPFFAVLAGLLLIPHLATHPSVNLVDIFCAALLYVTAVMAVYSAWTLIGYGFTVSILLDVERNKVASSQAELIQSFAGGNGLPAFVRDRAALLVKMKLMTVNGSWYTISGVKALLFAQTVRFAMNIYAIRKRELN